VSTHLTPERAIELLEAQIIELSELRNAHARDPRFKQWRQTTLTVVPIEGKDAKTDEPVNNYQLIYNELGVYLGQKLGNPCDDF